MKSFFTRNRSVFTVGLVTLAIFTVIIGASLKKPTESPVLQQISESELLAPHTYIRGNSKAPVALTMFCDFNEPKCAEYYVYVEVLYKNYPQYLKIGFRHFALENKLAAAAAQVAGEQNKFWEYTAKLFENVETEKNLENLVLAATQAGLDHNKFLNDMSNNNFVSVVDDDTQYAQQIGIEKTPAFLLNGHKITFEGTVDFKDQVEEEIKRHIPESAGTNPTTTHTTTPYTDSGTKTPVAPQTTTKPTLEILFNTNGWEPKSTSAYPGQLVRWTNQTTQTVIFKQIDYKFEELKNGVEIKAGESFEFRLYKDRLWRYKDEITGKWAEIFIKY